MKLPHRIVLEQVSIAIGNTPILKDINWTIESGQHWIITGNTSVGKTVLAGALAQRHRMIAGKRSYPFLGENPTFDERQAAIQIISFMDTSRLFRSVNAVHYYQQRFNAFDSDGHLTVRQYLEDGGFDLNPHQELFRAIGIQDLLDLERIKLSSGQTRKMLLAKVMLRQPKILIIDNPYIGLDKGSRQVLNELLDTLVNQRDMTLILSGHYQNLPSCITHRMHLSKEAKYQQAALSAFPLADLSAEVDQDALASISAHFHQKHYPESFSDILRFEDIHIRYGNKDILDHLSWRVKEGEKWVVMGSNGSGKSTLLSLIYGDNPQAYAHEIYLFDKRRQGGGESIWDLKKRIGFTSPELHAYFDQDLNAEQVVLTGLTDTFVIRQRPSETQRAFAKELFQYFGLEEKLLTPFDQLSTGTQRLLFFMRALVKAPPVLLLDEPFQGLDAPSVFRCKILLNSLLTEKHTLIFISHFKHELPDCVELELALEKMMD